MIAAHQVAADFHRRYPKAHSIWRSLKPSERDLGDLVRVGVATSLAAHEWNHVYRMRTGVCAQTLPAQERRSRQQAEIQAAQTLMFA